MKNYSLIARTDANESVIDFNSSIGYQFCVQLCADVSFVILCLLVFENFKFSVIPCAVQRDECPRARTGLIEATD